MPGRRCRIGKQRGRAERKPLEPVFQWERPEAVRVEDYTQILGWRESVRKVQVDHDS